MIGFMGGFSISLDEGICEYVYSKVGKGVIIPNDWDFQDYIALMTQPDYEDENARQAIEELLSHIGAAQTGYPYGEGRQLNFFYLYSQSFVTYLIDEYGIDKVRELILKGTYIEAYKLYLSKDYETVKNEWISLILSIEPKITLEEVSSILY